MVEVLETKFEKYLELTKNALKLAKESPENLNLTDETRKDFLDMIERYVSDAEHFKNNGDLITAFAAITYAHGWLDAGARIGIFDVHDSNLFAVDSKD